MMSVMVVPAGPCRARSPLVRLHDGGYDGQPQAGRVVATQTTLHARVEDALPRIPGSMPGPSSRTKKATAPGIRRAPSSMRVPSGVCTDAFTTRLRSACASRFGSARSVPSGAGRSSTPSTPRPVSGGRRRRRQTHRSGDHEVLALGASHGEEVVHQPPHPLELLADHARRVPRRYGVVRRLPLEELHVAAGDGDGRAQLVGCGGQEAAPALGFPLQALQHVVELGPSR